MKKWNNVVVKLHYYSDSLKRKLGKMRIAPATVIEAPSGYGKTTAVRDFLETGLPQGTPIYWFTATDEAPTASFRRFCREIEKIDSNAGDRLLKIEFPNAVTIGEATQALRSISCFHETYLVMDNFQLLHEVWPTALFRALLEHGGEGLHIIIVSQMFNRDMRSFIKCRGVLHISTVDLRLQADDILSYYALANVNITPEEAQDVTRYTEGWIIAVYLQLCSFMETGKLSDTLGILALMEHLIWDALTLEQKEFLLYLSPFEMVTVQQACALIGCGTLPEYAWDALNCPFIRYNPAERWYELHSILSDLLTQKRREQGSIFEHQCLLRAGDFCRDNGKTAQALGFYSQAKDYKRMLSLNLSNMIFKTINGEPFITVALDIAKNCSADLKREHILNMLRVAWALLNFGKTDAFDALMDELRVMINDGKQRVPQGLHRNDNSLLLGEWMLLSTYRSFPYLDEMIVILRQAAVLMGNRCSQVILPNAIWCFGNYSPLTEFYTLPGEADREADVLEEYIAIYSRLTNGHGSGADALFRAELTYQRGDLNGAGHTADERAGGSL